MEHALRSQTPLLSEAEFLAWVATQDGRYELLDGVAVMQAGATRGHERVAKRVFALLHAQVDETRFDVNKGDFGVRIRPGRGRGTILYPDVLVDLQSPEEDEQATLSPVVIVEVLSASTDYRYHVEKFGRYRTRQTLVHYAVFDQRQPVAYLWTRTGESWPAEPVLLQGLDAVLQLPAISAELELAVIYR